MLSDALLYGRAALIALAITASGQAQVGLGLSPMRQEFSLAPGAQQSGVLTLANDGGAHTRVVAEILDFYLDEDTTPQFRRQVPQEASYSCRQWMVANPMEMELRGNSHVPVRYTIRVPREATEGSYHCALGFTTQPTAEQITTTGMRNAVQIVSAFYVVVGKPALQGGLKNIRLEKRTVAQGTGWQAVVVIANSGLMHFRPVGALEVLDAAGAVVETSEFHPFPVLPRRDQNFIFPLQLKGGPGRYTLRARVDLGGNEIQEASALVVAESPAARN